MSIEAKDISLLVKKYPIPCGCLLLILSAALFLYFRAGQLESVTSKLDDSSKELKRLKANITAGSQIEDQLAVLVNANKVISSEALKITELATNPAMFYSLEKQSGITLTDLRQLVTSVGKGPLDEYIVIPFSVVAEGEFNQLMVFLKSLEYGNKVVRITNASLSPIGAATKLNLSFSIEVLGLR